MSIRLSYCDKCIGDTVKKYEDENISAILKDAQIISKISDLTFQVKRLERDMIDVQDKQKFYDNKSKTKESKYDDIKKFVEVRLSSVKNSQSSASHPDLKDHYKDFLSRLDGYESAYKNVLSFIKESENDM